MTLELGDIAIEDMCCVMAVERSWEIVQLRQGHVKLKGLFECNGYRWVSIGQFIEVMTSVCRPDDNATGGLVEIWSRTS